MMMVVMITATGDADVTMIATVITMAIMITMVTATITTRTIRLA